MSITGESVLLARTGWKPEATARGQKYNSPLLSPSDCLTGTRVQGLGSHDQRRAHRVERKFLKVVAGLLGEDLIDHESLVAPPGCFELAG